MASFQQLRNVIYGKHPRTGYYQSILHVVKNSGFASPQCITHQSSSVIMRRVLYIPRLSKIIFRIMITYNSSSGLLVRRKFFPFAWLLAGHDTIPSSSCNSGWLEFYGCWHARRQQGHFLAGPRLCTSRNSRERVFWNGTKSIRCFEFNAMEFR